MNILKHKALYPVVGIVLVSVLIVGVTMAVSSKTTSKKSPRSGIKGTTIVDGGCPIMREDTPCPDRPLTANITVTNADGGIAATTKSDADGHFQVSLPVGSYTVSAINMTGALHPVAMPQQVKVASGAFVDITIHFDSGIR
jgi:hypothetical protein